MITIDRLVSVFCAGFIAGCCWLATRVPVVLVYEGINGHLWVRYKGKRYMLWVYEASDGEPGERKEGGEA